MEKGKNRNDMLAAGKKKLQQYRQKKDQKGTGSTNHGKSSQKGGKSMPEAAGNPAAQDASAPVSVSVDTDAASSDMVIGEDQKGTGSNHGKSSREGDKPVLDAASNPAAQDASTSVSVSSDTDPVSSDMVIGNTSTSTVEDTAPIVGADDESAIAVEEVALPAADAEKGPTVVVVMERVAEGDAELALPVSGDEEAVLAADDKVASSDSALEEAGGIRIKEVNQQDGKKISELPEESFFPVLPVPLIDEDIHSCRSLHQEVNRSGSDHMDNTKETNGLPDCESTVMGHKEESICCNSGAGYIEESERLSMVVKANDSLQNLSRGCEELAGVCSANVFLSSDTEHVEEANGSCEQEMEVPLEVSRQSDLSVTDGSLIIENLGSKAEWDDLNKCESSLIEKEELVEREPVFSENISDSKFISESGSTDAFEVLKLQLYLANVTKECFQMQLSEQVDSQMEFEQRSMVLHNEVIDLRSLVKETQEINENISEELAYCRSELNALSTGKEELILQFLSGKEEIKELNTQCCELQNKLKESEEKVAHLMAAKEELQTNHYSAKEENEELKARASELTIKLEKSESSEASLSSELAECRGLLSDLQIENTRLTERYYSVAGENKKLGKEKEYFASENAKIEMELFEHKERFASVLITQAHLDAELKEALAFIESLSEENLYLFNILEIHKVKVKELDESYHGLLSQSTNVSYNTECSDVRGAVANKSIEGCSQGINDEELSLHLASEAAESGGMLGSSVEKNVDGFDVLVSFNRHLEECEKLVEKIEKLMQAIHSHSVTTRLSSKTNASGVSKLIQAFETKAHQDEIGSVEGSLAEEQSIDSFKSAKELVSNLRSTLEQLNSDLVKTIGLMNGINNSKTDMATALRDLQTECESQCAQNNQLVLKTDHLINEMVKYQTKLDNLQSQIDGLQQNANEMTGSVLTQAEVLQKEVTEKISVLDDDRNCLLSAVFGGVEKLDANIRLLISPSSPSDSDGMTHPSLSVDAAAKLIENLCARFESAYLEYERISLLYKELDHTYIETDERYKKALKLLDDICKNIENLVHEFCQGREKAEKEIEKEKFLDFALAKSELLINQLHILLEEKQHLESLKKELDLELTKRNHEMEGMNERCLHLSNKLEENESKKCDMEVIIKVLELIQEEIQMEEGMVKEDISPLMCLEALVPCFLQRHKEATEQVTLSVSFLKEVAARSDMPSDYWSSPLHILLKEVVGRSLMESNELQEKVYQLSAINLQKEDEVHMLKESVVKMEQSLEVARSECLTRTTELEQSEQRLLSVREKLGLAVAKGKGLIVQRDSLKQSLVEKSSELEKSLQELQLKDERLHEVEDKLKIYSEAGERIEALESELSYIRNSATGIRDSFLLKDSVLQRIEEVLEDLELPENFHSKDIIEKIEWLARSAAGSSLALSDWEHKNSVEGSFSDAGFVVMDAWREDSQMASKQGGLDDVRRKYEELERKFFGLAEHNEMLEQSLLERNRLVQRWEEVLDKINLPGELRSMEPEDRIEWLGKALAEAHRERDSWHLKVNELESSSSFLMAEVDESQKKLYDLNENFVAVTKEKNILSDKLEKLAQVHEMLSERAAQFELDRETVKKEVTVLQQKLSDSHEQYSLMMNEMEKLLHLVSEALPDLDIKNTILSDNIGDYLGSLLSTLVNRYAALSLEKSVPKRNDEDHGIQSRDEILEDKKLGDASDAMEQEVFSTTKELDVALYSLALASQEKNEVLDKYNSLVAEVEIIRNQRDNLQELLSQEEQKSASSREKLNVAVRKGKALVQQRDSLKQNIEGMSAELAQLKHELDQKTEDLSNKVVAMESDNSFLRNCLKQAEHEAEKLKKASELLVAELNEVHEKADNLQEELAKAEGEVYELSRQKDIADSARIDTLSNLDRFREHQNAFLSDITTFLGDLRKECSGFSDMLASSLSKDVEILSYVQAGMESFLKQIKGTDKVLLPYARNLVDEDDFSAIGTLSDLNTKYDASTIGTFDVIVHCIRECTAIIDQLKKKCLRHFTTVDQRAAMLPEIIKSLQREITLQKKSIEFLKEEKDSGISLLYRSLILLHEACTSSVLRIENQKVHKSAMPLKPLPSINELGIATGSPFSLVEELVRLTAESLLSAVDNVQSELNHGVLKATILDLQKEIQEKDLQTNRVCTELVLQIKEAEAAARNHLVELESAKTNTARLEKVVEGMKNEQSLLEVRLNQHDRAASKELEEKARSLTDLVAAKDQEIEALMQALDEEESQMESLTGRIEDLEKSVHEKNLALETLEASRGKVMSKLSTTVSRFNELHNLSDGLISEVENLQGQLESRDAEVSFLRQEVTKCTNDILTLRGSNRKNSAEVLEILKWLEMMASHFGVQEMQFGEKEGNKIHAYMECLEKTITSVLSELNGLRLMAQSRDSSLQSERNKVEELIHEGEALKTSLREKEAQLQMLQGVQDSGQSSNINSLEALEADQMRSKRSVGMGSITPHVRSLRKVNNDQVAVGIDLESGDTTLEDEDDDKAHGFKPLVMSRIVPRATRPLADKVDGLWVSGERMLMRQPTLRIGVVVYWILLHSMLATSII